MNRYQLAKMVDWAGTLDTRKRMQKVACVLQGADFNLHHYGPYSQEVARLTDEMVQARILDERDESNMVGQQFSYSLNEGARKNLADFEATPRGRAAAAELEPHEDLARRLFQ